MDDRHVQFVHHVTNNICGQNEFAGAETILQILEFILVSNKSLDDSTNLSN